MENTFGDISWHKYENTANTFYMRGEHWNIFHYLSILTNLSNKSVNIGWVIVENEDGIIQEIN